MAHDVTMKTLVSLFDDAFRRLEPFKQAQRATAEAIKERRPFCMVDKNGDHLLVSYLQDSVYICNMTAAGLDYHGY